jgi:hypothetical protein
MFTVFMSFVTAFWLSNASALEPGLRASLGKAVSRCKSAPRGAAHVWIFKQWHVEPAVDTRDRAKAKSLPQAANQTAAFRQLDAWVRSGTLKHVVAEGCSGELTRDSKIRFNGWSVRDLEAEASKAGPSGSPNSYDEIVASIPEKLEAKHGDRVKTLCGDDEALIKEHLRVFSDLRGTYGFLSRLLQYRDDPARAKTYVDGVIELYHLPRTTTPDRAIARLKTELKEAMNRLRSVLDRRNAKVVSVARASGARQVAVVFGGVHAPGLVKLLEAQGIGCTVVEPAGYNNDEAALLEQLEAAVAKLGA